MRELRVDELPTGVALRASLFHSGGSVLHSKGEVLTGPHIEAMTKAGIEKVFELGPDDWLEDFLFRCRCEAVKIADMVAGAAVGFPLSNEKGVLLLERGVRITEGMKKNLVGRGYVNLYRERTSEERNESQAERYLASVRRELLTPFKIEKLDLEGTELIEEEGVLTLAMIEKQLQEVKLDVQPTGEPLHRELRRRKHEIPRPMEEMAASLKTYQDCIDQTVKMMRLLKENQSFSGKEIGEMCRKIIGLLVHDKELLLNFVNLAWPGPYLPCHGVNVCVLATNIGTAMGYNPTQVLELAYAALLHDVGMLWVPAEILSKKGKLTSYERIEVNKHPYHAVEILRRIRGMPVSVPLIVFQTYERLDGGGYPRRLSEDKIHRFSKMIGVADVYDALTKPRPYRPAYRPYEAMRLTLQMVYRKEVDSDSVRAFLQYISLFPIGSYIKLSDGRVGKVISSNETDYTRPVVRLLWRGDQPLPEPVVVDLYKEKDLQIMETLRNADTAEALLEGF